MFPRILLIPCDLIFICDVLRNLIPFVQFKKHENTHRGVLVLGKVADFSLQLNKSDAPSWLFFKFSRLCKCYQIAQNNTYALTLKSPCNTPLLPNWQIRMKKSRGFSRSSSRVLVAFSVS